tara:strand:- start:187 stop:435 length:249 start_codon:yes stop_codon:yes gene_type:complete
MEAPGVENNLSHIIRDIDDSLKKFSEVYMTINSSIQSAGDLDVDKAFIIRAEMMLGRMHSLREDIQKVRDGLREISTSASAI